MSPNDLVALQDDHGILLLGDPEFVKVDEATGSQAAGW